MFQKLLEKFDITGKSQLNAVFQGRPPLSHDAFFLQYFENRGYPKDTVIRIKKVFDENVGFDLSRLSADDDFSKELNFIWDHDSLADVETVVGLEKEFGIKFEDMEAANLHTIREIVEAVHAKLKQKCLSDGPNHHPFGTSVMLPADPLRGQ